MWRKEKPGEVNEIILCDCIAECMGVRVTKFTKDHDPANETFLSFYWHGDFHQHRSRWKLLWHALTGRPLHIAEMVLNEADCRQMAEALTRGYEEEAMTNAE